MVNRLARGDVDCLPDQVSGGVVVAGVMRDKSDAVQCFGVARLAPQDCTISKLRLV
jgi:hypothetical protein